MQKEKAQKKNVFFSIAVRDSLTIIRTIKWIKKIEMTLVYNKYGYSILETHNMNEVIKKIIDAYLRKTNLKYKMYR